MTQLGNRYGIGPGGRPTRFAAPRVASRHLERGVDPDRPQAEDPVRARALADSASELLQSAAFAEAIEDLRGRAFTDMMNSTPGPEGENSRTLAHLRMTTLDDIANKLGAMVEDGKFATENEALNSEAESA